MTNQLSLLIEFLDELVFGVIESAKPTIRSDLLLTYTQIGMLSFIPGLVSSVVEPILGILGDVWRRKIIIVSGGILFGLSLLLTAISKQFQILLLSFVIFFPASGAFVTLSQANLMDSDPNRRNQNMARWTFAGSLGVVLGPLVLGVFIMCGRNWRDIFIGLGLLALLLAGFSYRKQKKINYAIEINKERLTSDGFLVGLKVAIKSIKNREVVRWLLLLEFSDLMLDILLGFLALYLVDVAGFSSQSAVLAIAIWTGAGLLGDYLLIPLLDRVDGMRYLHISVFLELGLFPAFLLFQMGWVKLVVIGLLGFFNSGWYAILKGELYTSMPGKSGTVMTLSNVAGVFGKSIPLLIGMVADRIGLAPAMWILLAGPIALLVGLPKRRHKNI
jgi:FSR family fosmidomycin resistance protein-like MFS transporter